MAKRTTETEIERILEDTIIKKKSRFTSFFKYFPMSEKIHINLNIRLDWKIPF